MTKTLHTDTKHFYYIAIRAARYIACDSHAHLVSKDGSD